MDGRFQVYAEQRAISWSRKARRARPSGFCVGVVLIIGSIAAVVAGGITLGIVFGIL